jgi:hypothetical protein
MQLKSVKSGLCLQYDRTLVPGQYGSYFTYKAKFTTCASPAIVNQKWISLKGFLNGLGEEAGVLLGASRGNGDLGPAVVTEFLENTRYETAYYKCDVGGNLLKKRGANVGNIDIRVRTPVKSFFQLF